MQDKRKKAAAKIWKAWLGYKKQAKLKKVATAMMLLKKMNSVDQSVGEVKMKTKVDCGVCKKVTATYVCEECLKTEIQHFCLECIKTYHSTGQRKRHARKKIIYSK